VVGIVTGSDIVLVHIPETVKNMALFVTVLVRGPSWLSSWHLFTI